VVLNKYKQLEEYLKAKGVEEKKDIKKAFLIATTDSNLEKVEMFIEKDPKLINISDEKGWTLLYNESGVDKVRFEFGQSGLFLNNDEKERIRRQGQQKLDIVRLPVFRGAKVNAKDKDGNTPIQYVKKSDFAAISEFLRKNGEKE